MKKIIPLLLILSASLLLACNGGDTAGSQGQPQANTTGQSAGAQPGAQKPTAHIILHDLSLWTEKDGSAVWAKRNIIGDRVTILGDPVELEYDKTVREYTPILASDGNEYYVRSPYAIANSFMAAIVKEATIHSEPTSLRATTERLQPLTLVAVEVGSESQGFVKIAYTLPNTTVVTNRWINADTITQSSIDVQAAIAIAVVNGTTDRNKDREKELKLAILESSLNSLPQNVFTPDMQAMKDLLSIKEPTAEEAKILVPVSGLVAVKENSVNIRSLPTTTGSEVVGQVNRGDYVNVVERTEAVFVVGNSSGHWFRIDDPFEGWIFGAFIEY